MIEHLIFGTKCLEQSLAHSKVYDDDDDLVTIPCNQVLTAGSRVFKSQER